MTATMHNLDVLVRDPREPIPNQGVSKVGRPETPDEWDVLRFELQHFVCEGEYAKGLDRILTAYLGNSGGADQVGAWVSGFYGSGKSHFVRVLDALWTDLAFPDGARARALVPALPNDIAANFRELSTRGAETGGVWSASGVLSSGARSFRLAVLDILFASAGLPTGYGPAKLALWLKREGIEQQVRDALAGMGTSLEEELFDLYVSTELAEAVRGAKPGFAASNDAALEAFGRQFPNSADISDNETLATVREILRTVSSAPAGAKGNRSLPATLIVLDEVQQYIGDQGSRALDVQTLAERLQSEFDSQVLLVCTGQAALQDTPQLQKLHGRYGVKVQLRTTDVEEVVRRVVLSKKPSCVPAIEQTLDAVSGEIDRHLAGSRLAPRAEDRQDLVADYPLLPARRRFWEDVLRAVDNTGQGGQLRSQLQVTQEATNLVADEPLGHVIPGDAIYDRLTTTMLQTGILLPSMDHLISTTGSADPLKGRILKTAFLIGQLPTSGAAPSGVRADAAHIADLLVTDLTSGSAAFRAEVQQKLDELAADSLLMVIDGQYRLQTEEGQAWDQDFRNRVTSLLNDAPRIANDRTERIKEALAARLKEVKLAQGTTKTKRDFAASVSADAPAAGDAIPVWVRDEWTASDKTVRADAAQAGTDSPTLFAFLPSRDAEDLKLALARTAAAQATLDARPNPATPEGQDARRGMQSRLEDEKRRRDAIVGQILDNAKVYQGGGTEVLGTSLADKVQQGLNASLARQFHKFTSEADKVAWAKVAERARQGNDENPIKAVGWEGNVEDNPVCKEIATFLLGGQRNGLAIRKHFQAPPFGWPQDTIDGALLALLVDGSIRATFNGKPRTAKDLVTTQIGQTEFGRESAVVSMDQRMQLKQLLTNSIGGIGIGGTEPEVQRLLSGLRQLADRASGDAPLPARPTLQQIDDLAALQGNALLLAVHASRDYLLQRWNEWAAQAEKVQGRTSQWQKLQRFLEYGEPLGSIYDEVKGQADAIQRQRLLLNEPDPVPNLLATLTGALRSALNDALEQERAVRDQLNDDMLATEEGEQLDDNDWRQIYQRHQIGPIGPLDIGTDEKLLAELSARPLGTRSMRIAALPTLFYKARLDAASIVAKRKAATLPDTAPAPVPPVEIKVPGATLRNEAEIDAYLARLRAMLIEQVAEGNTVVI